MRNDPRLPARRSRRRPVTLEIFSNVPVRFLNLLEVEIRLHGRGTKLEQPHFYGITLAQVDNLSHDFMSQEAGKALDATI